MSGAEQPEGGFFALRTTTTDLGPCECPGTPHERDEATQYTILGWDDVVDIALAGSEGAGRRIMVTRSIASWTLVESDAGGKPRPVPVSETTVRLIRSKVRQGALWERAYAAFLAARDPLPNESSAE